MGYFITYLAAGAFIAWLNRTDRTPLTETFANLLLWPCYFVILAVILIGIAVQSAADLRRA